MPFVSFVRSNYPHAYFSLSGNIITVDDINYSIPSIAHLEGMKRISVKPLADRKALFVGHALGIVIGEDEYTAWDKKDQVEVEYKEANGPLYQDIPDNIIYESKNSFEDECEGIVVEREFSLDRVSPYYIQPRELKVGNYGDTLLIHMSTQAPTVVEKILYEILETTKKIKVVPYALGGGFGGKQDILPDEVSIILLSYTKGIDLEWKETRNEDLMLVQSRSQVHKIKACVEDNNNNKIKWIFDEIEYDVGAFPLPWIGLSPLFVTLKHLRNVYSYNVYYNVRAILTNKPPYGAYRGFGRPEAIFVVERLMDEISKELKVDPLEFRKNNLRDLEFDAGNLRLVLDKLDEKRKKFRQGVGISLYVHYAFAPNTEYLKKRGEEIKGVECVKIVNEKGKVVVRTSVTELGQGICKSIEKIVRNTLTVNGPVEVICGDSSVEGYGTWASRSLTTAGNAAYLAAKQFLEKGEGYACYETEEILGAVGGQLTVFDGEKIIYQYIVVDAGNVIDSEIVKGQIIGGFVQGLGEVLFESSTDMADYIIPTAVESPLTDVDVISTPSKTPLGVRGVGENSIIGSLASVSNAISNYKPVYRIPVREWRGLNQI
ncbi:xanthine dehydrogenase family protein molybdopterin-binding subunit [Stygiolobus caldivivus]|uniref:Quinoline 2-oxidoreductase n=1 Tax=Stygiolobus caldivivus TaxID=2824673 RepID=A0A8D5ZHA3_9CREN|nr:molybdopterin cofactor-binding domain-containing protein [Stygiolobus caldivivus]BCU71653.1 quinoline 2-oxidoreductase [Stygiolobus caldivivus]